MNIPGVNSEQVIDINESTTITRPVDVSIDNSNNKSNKKWWSSRSKNCCLVPMRPIPLTVLTKPVFPNLTNKIINFTYKYVPGVSLPPSLIIGTSSSSTTITTSNNVVIDDESNDKEHPHHEQVIVRDTYGPLIRFLVLAAFSSLLFIALMYDGFSPRTANGKPTTYSVNSQFWPGDLLSMSTIVSCGEDGTECRPFSTNETWFGAHCLGYIFLNTNFFPLVRGSNGTYTADSNICYSAVHAGVINQQSGGCFEIRYAGAQDSFDGDTSNGVTTFPFSWFPKSIEYRAVTTGQFCTNTRFATDLLVCIGLVALALVWRIDAYWLNHLAAQWGFYYAGLTINEASGEFWDVIDDLMHQEFTLIPMCFFLFHFFGRPGFCPDPKRFPLEALFLFCVPFWIFIHMQDFQVDFDANFTFSSSLFQNIQPGTAAILIALVVIAPPLFVLQTRDLYKAGLLPYYVLVAVLFSAYLALIGAASPPNSLSFHMHHYFVGLFLCVMGRGQKKYSIAIQAIGLSLFCCGLAVYDTSSLYDITGAAISGYQVGDFESPKLQQPLWTRAELDNITGTLVTLEWALPTDLAANWECSIDLAIELDVPIILPTEGPTPSPISSGRRRQLSSSSSSLKPRSLLGTDPPFNAITTDDFDYYVSRNGILFQSLFTSTFSENVTDAIMTPQFPMIFSVAITNGGKQSYPLPIPYPNVTYPRYYDYDASLCDRLAGIYGKLNAIRKAGASQVNWWLL